MFEPLAEWLPRCDADVVCLQEVTRTPGLEGWTRFDDAERTLPQRANLFEDVRGALPRHRGEFVASDAGPVYDGQSRTYRRQEFGLATFVDERTPVLASDARFVHGSFVEHDEWPIADRPRVAQAVRVIDSAAERPVTVVHLHGLRDPQGKRDGPARLAQAESVASLVCETRAPEDLTVVCGDLNVLPDSETFSILGAIGLVDLVGTTDTRTSRYPKLIRHASYLLVSDPDAVKTFEVLVSPEVSDHRALVLEL
jgi:endonuclease/exonuclease/phosphatase family metal-dependent hydrolase